MRKSIFASLRNRSAAFLLVGALLLLLLTGNLSTALAVGNGTAAGQAKAPGGAATLAGSPSIDVTAPYADDDNADNSLLIEWGENGVDFALGSWSSAGHTPSPYSYSITGLDNAKGYQVRVTFSDGDGGTSLVQVLTGLRSYNSLLHNGVATGSSKHGGGNWGLADAGSKYGEFTCMTCHGPVTTNIKRVREAVVAPNFPTDAFPGSAVVLTDTRNSSADFGDDTRALPNTSTNVCEVCHSATAYHRYDATTNTGGTGHYNTLDCISCHKHRTAFRASCSGCHGNSSSGAIWPDDSTVHVGNDDPSGRHAKHMEILADKALGLTLAALLADAATETKQKQLCEYCHAANTNDSDHGGATPADVFVDSDAVRHAKTTWGAADNDALYNSGTDTCSNIDCHNSKLTTDATYGWYDAGTSACGLCHAADPATGAHTAHIGAAYGPLLGVKCGDCHEANDYNTNMTGISSHMDGDVDFTGGVLLVAATACNNCHGGATPAATAKANWSTASSVSCESCHGANAAATRNADGSGVTAPVRTTNYASKGHGRPGGTLPPNKACVDCHDASVAHISGALDDANRIKTIATKNYDTGGQANDWCNGCHTAAMPLHYGNGRTAGGTSDDGLLCNQCHDPHGNSGYDAMVAATIGDAGRSIAAFTDRTARGDYANASFDGVCQVCHELESAGQVDYFNRTENEAHYAGNCISCHKHDGTEAFKPSGCNGCHGDAVIGNFWPDGTTRVGSGADRDALHSIHVDPIGQNIAAADDATWAAMNATDKLNHKNSTCSYCHPDPGGTNASGGSHDSNTTGSPTEVADLHKDGFNPATSYTNLQGGADTTGSYNPTIKRCSTVTCHSNGEFTWTWYDDVLAPGPISDLVAVSGSEPGSVDLTWSAPYNDGSEGPNAYHYRVKQGGAAISSNALYDSASDAGGPPTVTRRGNSNSMTVQGLTPGGTYHFAVKTADEAYNWSAVSNSVSAVAKIDTLAPIFWGVGSAVVDDEPGTITLNWEAARDHSLPVTYKIWYSVGSIDYGLAPNATTQGTSFRVT